MSDLLPNVIAAKVSGGLSLIGSSLIIRDIVRRWRNKKNEESLPTVPCIILSMSLADLGTSLFPHFLGTWMVPNEEVNGYDPPPLATGNAATCATQAFMWNLFLYAGYGSNATLAVTYWLTVCRGFSETTLKKWKWQFSLLGIPWILGLCDAVVGMIFGFYSYNRLWFCHSMSDVKDPVRWRMLEIAAYFLLVNIIIVISMGALIRFVYLSEKKSRSYRRHSTDSNNSRSKTTLVTTQGLWFIMAYMVVVFPSLFALVMTPTPGYILFMACLHPLQGLLNAFVYFRPKYESERRRTVSSTVPVEHRPTRMSSVLRVLNIPLGALEGGNPPKNNVMHSPGVECNGNEHEQDNEAV